jgi:hypothetical protein
VPHLSRIPEEPRYPYVPSYQIESKLLSPTIPKKKKLSKKKLNKLYNPRLIFQ